MKNLSQENAPIYEALERFRRMRIVPFDVPGHKHGRGNKELVELLGERCVSIDVNSMKPLEICVIRFLLSKMQNSWQQRHFMQVMHF